MDRALAILREWFYRIPIPRFIRLPQPVTQRITHYVDETGEQMSGPPPFLERIEDQEYEPPLTLPIRRENRSYF